MLVMFFFFFKQKAAYEMRISDWSSDVCSSDLVDRDLVVRLVALGVVGVGRVRHVAGGADGAGECPQEVLPVTARRQHDALEYGGEQVGGGTRSEERRGGRECVSKCRSRWSP